MTAANIVVEAGFCRRNSLISGEFSVAILPIVQYPDPRLACRAEEVTQFDEALRELALDMAETMYDAPGVGLAAVQVGRNIRMVVIDVSDQKNDLKVLVNPVVEPLTDEEKVCEEGCLSLPNLYDKVSRPAKVRVTAVDVHGKPISLDCEGLLAVCVQHEVDHLNGIVFIDHLSRLKKSRDIAKLAKMRREAKKEQEEKEHEED